LQIRNENIELKAELQFQNEKFEKQVATLLSLQTERETEIYGLKHTLSARDDYLKSKDQNYESKHKETVSKIADLELKLHDHSLKTSKIIGEFENSKTQLSSYKDQMKSLGKKEQDLLSVNQKTIKDYNKLLRISQDYKVCFFFIHFGF
jgi:hypothetical protein